MIRNTPTELEQKFYNQLTEVREECFQLKLSLVEIKCILNLAKDGYRNIDEAIAKIDETLNKDKQ